MTQQPIRRSICTKGRNEVKPMPHGLITLQIVKESRRPAISIRIMGETASCMHRVAKRGYQKVIVILIKSIQTY